MATLGSECWDIHGLEQLLRSSSVSPSTIMAQNNNINRSPVRNPTLARPPSSSNVPPTQTPNHPPPTPLPYPTSTPSDWLNNPPIPSPSPSPTPTPTLPVVTSPEEPVPKATPPSMRPITTNGTSEVQNQNSQLQTSTTTTSTLTPIPVTTTRLPPTVTIATLNGQPLGLNGLRTVISPLSTARVGSDHHSMGKRMRLYPVCFFCEKRDLPCEEDRRPCSYCIDMKMEKFCVPIGGSTSSSSSSSSSSSEKKRKTENTKKSSLSSSPNRTTPSTSTTVSVTSSASPQLSFSKKNLPDFLKNKELTDTQMYLLNELFKVKTDQQRILEELQVMKSGRSFQPAGSDDGSQQKGFVVFDLTKKPATVLTADAAFCKMLGYEENEVLGAPWSKFVHPDYRERALNIFSSKNLNSSIELSQVYIHKNGEIVFAWDVHTFLFGKNMNPVSDFVCVRLHSRLPSPDSKVYVTNPAAPQSTNPLATEHKAIRLPAPTPALITYQPESGTTPTFDQAHVVGATTSISPVTSPQPPSPTAALGTNSPSLLASPAPSSVDPAPVPFDDPTVSVTPFYLDETLGTGQPTTGEYLPDMATTSSFASLEQNEAGVPLTQHLGVASPFYDEWLNFTGSTPTSLM